MNTLFLSLRVLHILLGATWLGATLVVSYFVLPAITEAGPDGGKVAGGLVRRGFDKIMASIAGLTVLSGLYLYWHYTDGFDPVMSGTMGARVFGSGGVLGIIAAVIGGAVVSKNMKRAVAMMKEAAAEPDALKRAPILERAGQLRQKANTGGKIVAVLLVLTTILMAMGHYV